MNVLYAYFIVGLLITLWAEAFRSFQSETYAFTSRNFSGMLLLVCLWPMLLFTYWACLVAGQDFRDEDDRSID